MLNILQLLLLTVCLSIPETSCQDRPDKHIEWRNDLILPPVNGVANPGVAGAYAGFAGDILIVAGGTNFPDARPWRGGTKTWYRTLYYIDLKHSDPQWHIVEDALPRPSAYGVSVELPDGLLCIGGCNAGQCLQDVFEIKQADGKIFLSDDWPSLPVPLANMTGALVDNRIYIAGGQESTDKQEATKHFFMLNLSDKRKGWVKLSPWEGEARGYAVGVAQSDGTEPCFYLFSGRDYRADGYVNILADAHIYHPKSNKWEKPDGLFPVMAGTAVALGNHQILLLGGSQSMLPGSDEHPGFDNTVRIYNTLSRELIETGTSPYPLPVTTRTVVRGNQFYTVSGEIKPGIRTPVILNGRIKSNIF